MMPLPRQSPKSCESAVTSLCRLAQGPQGPQGRGGSQGAGVRNGEEVNMSIFCISEIFRNETVHFNEMEEFSGISAVHPLEQQFRDSFDQGGDCGHCQGDSKVYQHGPADGLKLLPGIPSGRHWQ